MIFCFSFLIWFFHIFINGIPADGLDRSTFWAKNALRIEFMETSNDPQFQGKSNILNFVMKDYLAGGLTKIYARQLFPNDGDYNLSSKLVWGKMTYQALVKGGYSRNHMYGSDRTENYDDVWYGGQHYDNITRVEEADSYSRSNEVYGSFTARYRNKHFLSTHGVALQWNENPGSGMHGLTEYTPRILSGDNMTSRNSGRSLSPNIWGNYNMINNPKWYVGGSWAFAHSHNDGYSSYKEGNADEILTVTEENSYRGKLDLSTCWYPKKNMALVLFYTQKIQNYRTDYTCSVTSDQKQTDTSSEIKFQFWYQPIKKLTLTFLPQISFFHRNVNNIYKTIEKIPGINAQIYYSINNRSYLTLNSFYYQNATPVSERNDLILKQTEMKWIEGNPLGKTSDQYDINLRYNVFPVSWFNTNISADYNVKNNEFALIYRSGGSQYDGVIGQYSNSKRIDCYNVFWTIN